MQINIYHHYEALIYPQETTLGNGQQQTNDKLSMAETSEEIFSINSCLFWVAAALCQNANEFLFGNLRSTQTIFS